MIRTSTPKLRKSRNGRGSAEFRWCAMSSAFIAIMWTRKIVRRGFTMCAQLLSGTG